MAKVFLACEASNKDHPYARRDYERLVKFAHTDKVKLHSVCLDPCEADVIAFIGSSKPNFSDIRSSLLYKTHKEKSLIFYSGDRSIPILPGVYTCLEKRKSVLCSKSLLAGFYLRVTENSSLDIDEDINNAKYLFSFVGNINNHPMRKKVYALSSHRSYLRDSSTDVSHQGNKIVGGSIIRTNKYNDIIANSKFVLCPRGIGVSSWRLFETMRAGRVPVIISDDWVAPKGPEWDLFTINIKENAVWSIPFVLAENEHLAEKFGAIARKEWETWYSEGRVFTTVVDLLIQTKKGYLAENHISRIGIYKQYFGPFFFRHWVLSPTKALVKRYIFQHSS